MIATGNKSELATGYSTLYGDMAGGFAILKDVPKTLVYEVAGWRNASGPTAIPARVFTKPRLARVTCAWPINEQDSGREATLRA